MKKLTALFLSLAMILGLAACNSGTPSSTPSVPSEVPACLLYTSGALAQLGERYTGSVEVSGSIPLCSTTSYKSEPCAVRRWVRIYFYRPEIYPISAIKRDGLFYGALCVLF